MSLCVEAWNWQYLWRIGVGWQILWSNGGVSFPSALQEGLS
jgi:hypothetical protein